jgi:hypothetical protein
MTIPVLVVTGMNFPPYSQRGVVQTLAPIRASQQTERTVNGELNDISDPIFKKFISTITVNDQEVPQFIWPGATVTVDCVAELSYKTSGGSPERTVASSRVSGAYTFYRPRLTMIVNNFSINHDEWGRTIGWTLELEEV